MEGLINLRDDNELSEKINYLFNTKEHRSKYYNVVELINIYLLEIAEQQYKNKNNNNYVDNTYINNIDNNDNSENKKMSI